MRDVFKYCWIYFDHTQFQELMNDLQICTQAFAIKFKRHTYILTHSEYIYLNYEMLRTLIWPYELLLSFKGTAKIYTPTNNQSFNFNIPEKYSAKCQKIMNEHIFNIYFSCDWFVMIWYISLQDLFSKFSHFIQIFQSILINNVSIILRKNNVNLVNKL